MYAVLSKYQVRWRRNIMPLVLKVLIHVLNTYMYVIHVCINIHVLTSQRIFPVVKMKKLERVCIQFCFKFGKTFAEMLQQAYGDDCMSQTQWYQSFTRFKVGRTSTDENPSPGCSSTSISNNKIDEVRTTICEDHHLTIREIAKNWVSA